MEGIQVIYLCRFNKRIDASAGVSTFRRSCKLPFSLPTANGRTLFSAKLFEIAQ